MPAPVPEPSVKQLSATGASTKAVSRRSTTRLSWFSSCPPSHRRSRPMHTIESVFGDITVVSCMGKMTQGEGDEVLSDKIDSLMIQGCRKVILDLAAVPYIDSVGLQATVRSFLT